MQLLEKAKSLVGLGGPETAGAVSRPKATGSYMRGGRGVTISRWHPALRESQDDISEAWDGVAARVTDMVHNSGWLSGMIDQAVANTVGEGLRLKSLPENNLFGMSDAEAAEWSKDVERRFELWSKNPQECDIQGLRRFGQMQGAAFRSWIGTGEILSEHVWKKRPWNLNGTKLRLLPPTRLARSSDDWRKIVNGVQIDRDGYPIGYLAVKIDKLGMEEEVLIRARDPYGRPRVTHVFDGLPGTFRGISPLAPVIQVAKQFDQLADATLMSAIVQTLFAATIEGDEPTEDLLAGLLTPQEQAQANQAGVSLMEAYVEMTRGYYDEAGPLDVGINGRMGFLFPGQKLNFHTSAHSSENYEKFANFLLREMARTLGMTYESATGDNVGATYSSLQASTTEIFAITKTRRANILVPFCQPAYETWLEEQIERGDVPFPGGIDNFLANRTAACRAEWRGDPRPRADDLKTAKAHETWKRMGIMSDARIANDLGFDIEDSYAEQSQELQMRKDYGLPEPVLEGAVGGQKDPPMIENEGGSNGDA